VKPLPADAAAVVAFLNERRRRPHCDEDDEEQVRVFPLNRADYNELVAYLFPPCMYGDFRCFRDPAPSYDEGLYEFWVSNKVRSRYSDISLCLQITMRETYIHLESMYKVRKDFRNHLAAVAAANEHDLLEKDQIAAVSGAKVYSQCQLYVTAGKTITVDTVIWADGANFPGMVVEIEFSHARAPEDFEGKPPLSPRPRPG